MYFISYLADVLAMTTSLYYPLMFNSAKLKVLNRFAEASRDNFGGNSNFKGNLNYITLCLTDNLTMTNFFTLPPNFKVG